MNYLATELKEKVYNPEDIEMLENIREILNLEGKITAIEERGPIETAHRTWASFRAAAEIIDRGLEAKCTIAELRLQYKLFF